VDAAPVTGEITRREWLSQRHRHNAAYQHFPGDDPLSLSPLGGTDAARYRAQRPSWRESFDGDPRPNLKQRAGEARSHVSLLKIVETLRKPQFPRAAPVPSGGMVTILFALVSLLSFRFRSRASQELELVALRHQVIVLRRQRPHRLRLLSADRLLWIWLYGARPQVLETLVLVKPTTVVKWHRKGFRIYWRWRSRCPGRTLIYPR